jgi:ATP-dependent Clp protease ATP-binding subunit ClpA
VQLHEPTVSEAVTILRGLAQVYEKSHGIYLRDDAVVAAAELSARYLAGRQLPDKAVDVLDTACARVRISLAAAPESLERLRGELAEGGRQRQALRRDAEAGLLIDHEALDALEARLDEAESKWPRWKPCGPNRNNWPSACWNCASNWPRPAKPPPRRGRRRRHRDRNRRRGRGSQRRSAGSR